MLAYLDALIAALTERDAPEVARLLAHPLARTLPAEAVSEAEAAVRAERDASAPAIPWRIPLRVLQLRHRTAELLREEPPVADAPEAAAGFDALDALEATVEHRGLAPAAPRSTREGPPGVVGDPAVMPAAVARRLVREARGLTPPGMPSVRGSRPRMVQMELPLGLPRSA
jgi:hypothetical protein